MHNTGGYRLAVQQTLVSEIAKRSAVEMTAVLQTQAHVWWSAADVHCSKAMQCNIALTSSVDRQQLQNGTMRG